MVERACISDIDSLTALRLAYLQEDCGELNEEVISKLLEDLPAYFEKILTIIFSATLLGKWKKSLPVHSC